MLERCSWLRHLVFGIAAGAIACAPVAVHGASCPPSLPMGNVQYTVPQEYEDDEEALREFNVDFHAQLFGGSTPYTMFLAAEPTVCGYYNGHDSAMNLFTFEIVHTQLFDLSQETLTTAQSDFVTSADLQIRVVLGFVHTANKSFWAGSLVFSMDTTTQGRIHGLAFGEAYYHDGTELYAPITHDTETNSAASSLNGPNPGKCAELIQKCKDNFDAHTDICDAALGYCLAGLGGCLVGIAWSLWFCVVSGVGCVALAWMSAVCGKMVKACIAAQVACRALAAGAYARCMSRAMNDPACEGFAWD